MTWNILAGSDYFKKHKDNPAEFVDFVLAQNPDVVTFQEYYGNRISKGLYDLMIQHYPYYVCQNHECQVCVFSRYPLGGMEQMVVDTATVEGRNYWESLPDNRLREYNCYRFVLSVPVQLPDGDSLQLIACHLGSNNFTSREKGYADGVASRKVETAWIVEKTREMYDTDAMVIVCGDMNDVAGSITLRSLQRGGLLRNAWWERGRGLGMTFRGYGVLRFRLDHILHTDNIKLKGVRVVRQNFSDHHPLVASFDLSYD